MKVLITGHLGYIGNKLFKQLMNLGHEVRGLDLKEDTPNDVSESLAEDIQGKFNPYWFDFEPEFVFHMACWQRVGFSIENPVETMKNNVLCGSIALNYALKVGSVRRFIYSSSSSVVGSGYGPTSPYALQKLATEMEAKIYSEIYGLETVSLRYFNVYSEDQKTDGPYSTAVASWMECVRKNNNPFITGDGNQARDMIHVDDVVSANIFAMNYDGLFKGQHYDVGTGKNISLNQIKNIVQRHHDIKFDYVKPRPGEVLYTKANTKPLSELGWNHSIKITDGINNCFRELKK